MQSAHRSVVGLTGVSLALQPEGWEPGQACDGLGVMIVAILWSGTPNDNPGQQASADFAEHLWTLALAIATFLILIHVGRGAGPDA